MGQAQHPKTSSSHPCLPPLDLHHRDKGSQEQCDDLMEVGQLMQGRAGIFDLGLFGGEPHGLSLHSTVLSSPTSCGGRKGLQGPLFIELS